MQGKACGSIAVLPHQLQDLRDVGITFSSAGNRLQRGFHDVKGWTKGVLLRLCTLFNNCVNGHDFDKRQHSVRISFIIGKHCLHCLQADDRLLVVSEAAGGSPSSLFGPDTADPQQQAGPRLGVQHIRIPQQYIAARYPLTHASISPDGMDIAVAGTRGLGLYSRRSSRWRLFGDVSQEREIMVQVRPSHAEQQNMSCVL